MDSCQAQTKAEPKQYFRLLSKHKLAKYTWRVEVYTTSYSEEEAPYTEAILL